MKLKSRKILLIANSNHTKVRLDADENVISFICIHNIPTRSEIIKAEKYCKKQMRV